MKKRRNYGGKSLFLNMVRINGFRFLKVSLEIEGQVGWGSISLMGVVSRF